MAKFRALLLILIPLFLGVVALAQQTTEPQGKFVEVNGHRLWYRISGKGNPLLIIPGGPGASHTYCYPAFDRLADSFQLIYFDAFGRGKSDRAKSPTEYSLNHDIDEIEGLRKALRLGKISIYGHSYGGVVAQGYAIRYPDSLNKLLLANTFYSAEMWQKGNNDNWNHEIQNQFPEIWAEIQHLRSKGGIASDPSYQKVSDRVPLDLLFIHNPLHANFTVDTNFDIYYQIAGPDADIVLGGELASMDFRKRLRDIRTPTLVIAGRYDRVCPPLFSLQYRGFMPQAEFVMFEQSAHFPFIEEPASHDSFVRAFLSK